MLLENKILFDPRGYATPFALLSAFRKQAVEQRLPLAIAAVSMASDHLNDYERMFEVVAPHCYVYEGETPVDVEESHLLQRAAARFKELVREAGGAGFMPPLVFQTKIGALICETQADSDEPLFTWARSETL
jgi:hypothetical protein